MFHAPLWLAGLPSSLSLALHGRWVVSGRELMAKFVYSKAPYLQCPFFTHPTRSVEKTKLAPTTTVLAVLEGARKPGA
jgi:hypothetical protein